MELYVRPLEIPGLRGETSVFAPLQAFQVEVSGARRSVSVHISLSDGAGQAYLARTVPVRQGQAELHARAYGAAGTHTVKAMADGEGQPMMLHRFPVRPRTWIHTDCAEVNALAPSLFSLLDNRAQSWADGCDLYRGLVSGAEAFLDDQVAYLRAARHADCDPRPLCDAFFRLQPSQPPWADRLSLPVAQGRADASGADAAVRPPLCDAAIVASLAEATHLAWQATGDDEWMRHKLPMLDGYLALLAGEFLSESEKASFARAAALLARMCEHSKLRSKAEQWESMMGAQVRPPLAEEREDLGELAAPQLLPALRAAAAPSDEPGVAALEPAKLTWAVQCLLAGVVGLRDLTSLYGQASLAPRWNELGVNRAFCSVHYAASGAYFAYEYDLDPERRLSLALAGSGSLLRARLWVPAEWREISVHADRKEAPFTLDAKGGERYAELELPMSCRMLELAESGS